MVGLDIVAVGVDGVDDSNDVDDGINVADDDDDDNDI